MAQWVVLTLAVALAGLVQGSAGAGFTLVCIPLFTLALGPGDAVGVAARLALAAEAALVVRHRGDVDLHVVRDYLGAAALAVPVGLLVVGVAPASLLVLGGAGVALLGSVALAAAAARPEAVAVPDHRWVRYAAGFTSGVLGVSTGLSGPPVALERAVRPVGAIRTRATLAVFFVVTDVVVVGTHPTSVGAAGVAALVAVAAGGSLVGTRLAARVPEPRLRAGLVVVVGLSAVSALARQLL